MKFKGLLFVILVSVSSCAVPIRTLSVYDKQYFSESAAVKDVYSQITLRGLDSIPLNQWITLEAKGDDIYLMERTLRCFADKKTSYRFIYLIYERNQSWSYVFKILCDTKEKKNIAPAKCLKRTPLSNSEIPINPNIAIK